MSGPTTTPPLEELVKQCVGETDAGDAVHQLEQAKIRKLEDLAKYTEVDLERTLALIHPSYAANLRGSLKEHINKAPPQVPPGVGGPGSSAGGKKLTANQVLGEITSVIDTFRPYDFHTISQDEADKFQQQRLGRFFRKGGIVYGKAASHITLTMLPLDQTAPEPKSEYGESISAIIKEDVGVTSDKRTLVMIGRPGCGKTATVVRTAQEHFLVYICCCTLGERLPDLHDPNFNRMVSYITERDTISRTGQWNEGIALVERDKEMKLMAMARARVEILGRLMFLLILFREDPSLTPGAYFREQVNGGSRTIESIVLKLLDYDNDSINALLSGVFNQVTKCAGGRAIVIAVDEAQLAQYTLFGLVSPSALAGCKGNYEKLIDAKGMLLDKYRRGFLTPLCGVLGELDVTIIVCGTAFSLSDADQVGTAFIKKRRLVLITRFPNNSAEEVDDVINTVVDLSGCVTPPPKRQKLAGRKRNTMNPIVQLITTGDTGGSKQEVWDNAVDLAIRTAREQLVKMLDQELDEDPGGMALLLSRMVIGGSLDGRVAFPRREDADLVNKGICALELDASGGYYWKIKEPLVLEAIVESLQKESVDAVFATCLSSLESLLTMLGPTTSTTGNILEPVVRRALSYFSGVPISDLPFLGLKKANLPLWAKQHTLTITDTGTAQQLNFANDADFLSKRTPGLLLCPEPTTRPDSALFLSPSYGVSLAIKFYTSTIHADVQMSNESSSDLRKCFLQVSGDINPSVKNYRASFEKSLAAVPIHGVLRILVEFPGGIVRQSRVEGQDIIVYVTCDNIDAFFNEAGRTEQEKRMFSDLKVLIHYVAEHAREDQNKDKKKNAPVSCGCKTGCATNRCQKCKSQGQKCTSACVCTGCKNK